MTTQTIAPVEPKAQMETIFNNVAQRFAYLWDRWQDEQEYEDWADYAKDMEKTLREETKGLKFRFLKATKRPFGCTFIVFGRTYQISANSRYVSYKRVYKG